MSYFFLLSLVCAPWQHTMKLSHKHSGRKVPWGQCASFDLGSHSESEPRFFLMVWALKCAPSETTSCPLGVPSFLAHLPSKVTGCLFLWDWPSWCAGVFRQVALGSGMRLRWLCSECTSNPADFISLFLYPQKLVEVEDKGMNSSPSKAFGPVCGMDSIAKPALPSCGNCQATRSTSGSSLPPYYVLLTIFNYFALCVIETSHFLILPGCL